jgi:CRISPR/Cas system-associated exonuclease Cas4 (RecB family)
VIDKIIPEVESRRITIDGERFYEVNGRLYPSVTTILSVVAKPALVKWAKKTAIDFVRAAVGDAPFVTKEELDAILDRALGEPERIKNAAADRGTALHEGIADRAKEGIGQESEILRRLGLAVIATEVTVHSELGFAGTADVIAVDHHGRLVVVDWKSGGVWPEHAMQVAAYRLAVAEMTRRPVGGAYVIGLKGKQPAVHRVSVEPATRGFLGTLELYRALRGEELLSLERTTR